MSNAPVEIYLSEEDAELFGQKYGHPNMELVEPKQPCVTYIRSDALPEIVAGMVEPLVWVNSRSYYTSGDYCAYHTGCIFGSELKYAWGYGPSVRFGAKTLDEAKVAAQAHHTAQVLDALGLEPKP